MAKEIGDESVVYVGVRRDGCVGYFASEMLPEGWRLASENRRDISDVMLALRASKAEALKEMNSHWQR